MVTGHVITVATVGAVAVERLAELWISRCNARLALARGAVEIGQRQYVVMAVFHATFLIACVAEPFLLERSFIPALAIACLILLGGAQALRWWAIVTLGPRWNTRIIVIPDAEPVTGGPYRWLRHPNYVAVIVEMLALPLLSGAWLTAIVASLGNAMLLRARIGAEERALGARWARAFSATPRFVPGGPHAGA